MRHPSWLLPALAWIAVLLAPAAEAQPLSADWRTLETEHFRLHYPRPAEAWAREAATKIESIRKAVAAEVGWAPTTQVDVVVIDPFASANGSAIPRLGRPRMVLYTSPPGPESVIGHYRDWAELLLVHEDTHLVHLLRPSRNPAQRWLSRLLPVGPIPRRAPRWVTEGYATVIEGRLTGSGRPASDLRAAILRRRAQAGKLPTYGELSSDPGSWLGMSMAYLAGSAYLEWLERREGEGSLRKLWARMTARADRGFEAAFRGVFGDSAENLYDRFRAELIWSAIEMERRLEGQTEQGELWQKLAWTSGPPTVSPSGDRVALVLRHRDKRPELVVFSTAPDDEAAERRRTQLEERLAADPEDVAPVEAVPWPREPIARLASHAAAPAGPRFLPDGESLLLVRFEPDRDGVLRPDLFTWHPERRGDALRRLTHGADLREPDPSPDGRWAVAVHRRWGASQLVRVDLESAAITELTQPRVNHVWAQPRIAPGGERLATVRHREGRWELVILDLETGLERVLPTPARTTIAYPAWSADGGQLFASLGREGAIEIWRLDPEGEEAPVQVTRGSAASVAAAPTPSGDALFFLGLEPSGLELRRLGLSLDSQGHGQASLAETLEATSPSPLTPQQVAPALPLPPPEAPEFAHADPGPDRPYGLGRLETSPLSGFRLSSAGDSLEAGVRVGDLLGRFELLALASGASEGTLTGGGASVAWKGAPIELQGRLFSFHERPSRLDGAGDAARRRLFDLRRTGAELTAARSTVGSGWRLRWETGLWVGRLEPDLSDDSLDRRAAFVALDSRHRRIRGPSFLGLGVGLHAALGETGEDRWRRWRADLEVEGGVGNRLLAVGVQTARTRGTQLPQELSSLGGLGATSLLSRLDRAQRFESPALPDSLLVGAKLERQYLRLTPGPRPWPELFWERSRSRDEPGLIDDWLSLAGLEWRFRLGPQPLVGLPGVDLRVGAARLLDPPFEDESRWWAALAWRP